MKSLIDGHQAFRSSVYPSKKALFERLGKGQEPKALFITCSDSRVDPELITGSDPGEIFVIRNAGNLVPAHGSDGGSVSGTVEYAIVALEVPVAIVCGHSGCGAMKAVLDPDSLEELPEVEAWLGHAHATRMVLEAEDPDVDSEEDLLKRCVEVNTLVQLQALATHPSVAARLAEGSLALHAWVYDIPSGQITAYDPESKAFVPLEKGAIERPARASWV